MCITGINSALPTAMRSRTSREFLRKGGNCVGEEVNSVTFLCYMNTRIFRYTLLDGLTRHWVTTWKLLCHFFFPSLNWDNVVTGK